VSLRQSSWICLSSALFLISVSTSVLSADDSKNNFAFVFNSSRNPNHTTFSLYGSYPVDKKVKLLHIASNKICDAVT